MKKLLIVLTVVCVLFVPTAYAASTFKDVKEGAWYYPFVMKSSQMGIIDGYKDGTFRPNDNVTRAQLSKIMANYDDKAKQRQADEDEVINAISKSIPSIVKISTDSDTGSAFFIRKNILLTNAHVVGSFSKVQVKLSTGQTIEGTVLQKDPAKDIAIVQVSGNYNHLTFANDVIVGQTSIALGNPQDMDFSATKGIVSKLNITEFGAAKMFQTDTPINSGNSGGALINSRGEVLGMVTGKLIGEFGNIEGMAYAIHYSELERYLKIYGK